MNAKNCLKGETCRRLVPGGYLQAEGIAKGSDTGPERKDVMARTRVVYGTAGWQHVETTCSTGKHHRRLIVFCGLGDYGAHTTGTAFFDGIRLQEVPTSYASGVFGDYPHSEGSDRTP